MLALDHLVIYAKDPKHAANQFGKKHHIKVIQGGTHDHWGTYNYLAYFANNSYIEWIGIFDEHKAKQSQNPLIKQLIHQYKKNEEGMFHYALRTEHMESVLNHFQTNNIPFTGPVKGRRKKKDGTLLAWEMTFPKPHASDIYPFLIQWGEVQNKPTANKLINKQKLQTIQAQHSNSTLFHKVYNIPFNRHEHEIKLTNAHLTVSDQLDSYMDFSIKER